MVDFLVITRSIQPIFILKVFFYKTTYLNEEVNCTERFLVYNLKIQ